MNNGGAARPGETGRGDVNLTATIRRLLADERIRFMIVGGFNTAFGYAVYVGLHALADWPYLVSLYGSYLVSTLIAFVLHRRFTYRRSGTGNMLLDFVRFQGVYVVSLAINTVALPLLVEVAHWDPLVAQAVIVVITAVVSYFGHKFFSFRRPKDA